MFSPTSTVTEHCAYNFDSEENVHKWRPLFIDALQKVQRQVHPSLSVRDDAVQYIESLILNLLGMLSASQPHTVQDVEERVQKTFPHPIDKWAIAEAQGAQNAKGKKAKSPLELPVEKIHSLLVKEVLGYKVDFQVSLYIVAVLEYIAADIFKLTGNYVKNIKHHEITCQDIKVAMCADKVLMDMFFQDEDVIITVEEEPAYNQTDSLSYEEIVKDLILEETQYLRDLNMIIKVFREPFASLFAKSKDLEVIFSNILDVYEFTVKFLGSLEDAVEMSGENSVPMIGACFEERAEDAEFDVYEKYTEDMLKPNGRERLNVLLQRPDVIAKLQTSGHKGFRDAVKYVLPKLLLGPIYHCLHYFDVLKALINTSWVDDDKESLEQATGLLHPIKLEVDKKLSASMPKRKPGETSLRFPARIGRQASLDKMNELQKSIDGWEGKNIWQSCNEFIMEGLLNKYAGKKQTERHIFLFDGLIILCKTNTRRSSVTGPVGEFRLKEKFYIRKIDIVDKEDTEEVKNSFEIQVRDHPNLVLVAKTAEEKNNWMATLVSLLKRSMLERMLDSILKEEVKQQPLRLPCSEQYRFSEEDSEENIVFEDHQDPSLDCPLIKGGTILKLVERLTYHKYADLNFVRTFLTTYRSFCKPQELLALLKERFEIPDAPVSNENVVTASGDLGLAARDDLKRFRQEYCKPVQFRVLNVLRHWADHHFYDFERDPNLLAKLQEFLQTTVKGKAMRKWVETITKVIQRRMESPLLEREFTLDKTPPPIEWFITKNPEDFDLMTLHPIEIARQVTLLEFDLYRAVKPSELVGSVWVKKTKNETSPNLLKMIHHSTVFTFWLEKCIIEAENFEERVAIVSRIIEIMIVFQELNNFNGVLEVVSALNSAPVYRLHFTYAELPMKHCKAYDEAKDLNSDHFKKYIEKLRSINPPCVPFLGMYLTNILKTEEGNPDFLPNRPDGIINFSKRRKVAEITGEIEQYQNQPYCLKSDESIRSFIENLNPLGDMTEKEFNDYLYNKSLEIEPRNARQLPRYERKREYTLKSPGIKPQAARHSSISTIRNLPPPLPETQRFTFHKIDDDMEPLMSSQGATPPTPSTPLTPPHTSDNSVFANILISGQQSSIYANNSTLGLHPTEPPILPPPVPPRRRRESSLGDVSPKPVQQASDAPALPPRDSPLPPRPPRRDIHHGTLPRAQSMTITRQSPAMFGTLPRRNSDRDHVNLNVNGTGIETPELPPKTYLRSSSNSRKQSS